MSAARVGLAAALALVAIIAACTPDSKIVPCTNDGECKAASSQYRFCAELRCVECVGRGSCGVGHACVEGHCE